MGEAGDTGFTRAETQVQVHQKHLADSLLSPYSVNGGELVRVKRLAQ